MVIHLGLLPIPFEQKIEEKSECSMKSPSCDAVCLLSLSFLDVTDTINDPKMILYAFHIDIMIIIVQNLTIRQY